MIVINNLVILSRLGKTDCRRRQIYYEDNKIFVQNLQAPAASNISHAVALPIIIARLASEEATEAAIERISQAQQQMKVLVDVTDLEADQGDFS